MVIKRCCVPNCSNIKSYSNVKRKLDPQPQRTFRMFKFPFKGDPQRARKWADVIGKPEMEMKSSTFICSDHFRTEDYLPVDDKGSLMDLSVGRHCLGSWAIPSLFLSISAVPKEEEKCKAVKDSGNAVEFFGEREGEPCLICSMDCNQSGALRAPLKFNDDAGSGLSSVLLNDQLWSTFILRNVLKLSQGDYQHLLERVGGSVHPAKWFVICRVCERALVQILDVYESLKKLEKRMERLSIKLKNKFQESMVKEVESNEWNVRQEIRRCLKASPLKQPKQEPEEEDEGMMISDFDESWLPRPPSPPPPPVKDEDSLPTPELPKKKARLRPTAKRLQIIKKLRLTKTKSAQPSKPRPPRIRNQKNRAAASAFCELCGHNAGFPVNLERHMQMHKIYDNCFDSTISSTHFFCNLCSPHTLFPTRLLLGAHKREKHSEELNLHVFKCSECPEVFLSKWSQANHLLNKHPLKFQDKLSNDPNDKLSQQKIYKCEKCDFRSLFPGKLKRHVNYSHSSAPLICQHCSCTTKNPNTLYRHMKIYHPELAVYRKRSDISNLSSVDGKPIPEAPHAFRKVSGDKRFPCKNCEAVFTNKLELKLHLENSHKDLFTYQCDMCDKSYLRQSSLQTHRKINHLESGKKVKCGYCGRTVSHKIYLWTHMKFCQKKPQGIGPAIYAVEVDDGHD